jgi:hypothetical protein
MHFIMGLRRAQGGVEGAMRACEKCGIDGARTKAESGWCCGNVEACGLRSALCDAEGERDRMRADNLHLRNIIAFVENVLDHEPEPGDSWGAVIGTAERMSREMSALRAELRDVKAKLHEAEAASFRHQILDELATLRNLRAAVLAVAHTSEMGGAPGIAQLLREACREKP